LFLFSDCWNSEIFFIVDVVVDVVAVDGAVVVGVDYVVAVVAVLSSQSL
jgi:hypothetical protein